jgi:hypothetical protein
MWLSNSIPLLTVSTLATRSGGCSKSCTCRHLSRLPDKFYSPVERDNLVRTAQSLHQALAHLDAVMRADDTEIEACCTLRNLRRTRPEDEDIDEIDSSPPPAPKASKLSMNSSPQHQETAGTLKSHRKYHVISENVTSLIEQVHHAKE